jgi:hypothetical protein
LAKQSLITRSEAKAAGLTKYFTGKPCKRGHICERYMNGGCSECSHARGRASYARNLAQRLVRAAVWREANPIKAKEISWKQQGIHSAIWFSKFLKWPEYIEKIYEQQGVCWGCGKLLNPYDRNTQPDHCHTTEIFRHVLCVKCNATEGVATSPLGRLLQQDSDAFVEQHSW